MRHALQVPGACVHNTGAAVIMRIDANMVTVASVLIMAGPGPKRQMHKAQGSNVLANRKPKLLIRESAASPLRKAERSACGGL